MAEAGGRRIKRSIVIKSGSVKFCDEEMISQFRHYNLLNDYLDNKIDEIKVQRIGKIR